MKKKSDKVVLTKESYYGTRQKAIRKKCEECCGASSYKGVGFATVRDCDMVDCPLWLFRTGYSVEAEEAKQQMEIMKGKV